MTLDTRLSALHNAFVNRAMEEEQLADEIARLLNNGEDTGETILEAAQEISGHSKKRVMDVLRSWKVNLS